MPIDNLLADLNSILLYRKSLLSEKARLMASNVNKYKLAMLNREIAEATSAIKVIHGLLTNTA